MHNAPNNDGMECAVLNAQGMLIYQLSGCIIQINITSHDLGYELTDYVKIDKGEKTLFYLFF